MFEEGDDTTLHGLISRPDLNGQTGTLVQWHEERQRWAVELDESEESIWVKPENLSRQDPEAALEAVLTDELCAGARAWLSQPVELVTKARESTVLFVPEGAWACVPRDSTKLDAVGTDDATTCHCVALISPTHVALAHVNDAEPAEALLGEMLIAVGAGPTEDDAVSVHIGGGMGGEGIPTKITSASVQTSLALLAAVARRAPALSLRLACVGFLNTTAADGNPACRGMCVGLRGGEVSAAPLS